MANSDKNILITPSKNLSGLPEIEFTGAGNSSVTLTIPDSSTGTLEFRSGVTTAFSVDSQIESGNLFSVTNEYNTEIFSVSDKKITITPELGKIYFNGSELILPHYEYFSLPSDAEEGGMVFDSTYNVPRFFNGSRWVPLGNQLSGMSPETAGYSALQIKADYPDSVNGSYWIYIDEEPVEVYCDMGGIDGGGWTLIGKSRGTWNAPNIFLKRNFRMDQMTTNLPLTYSGTWACINAVDFCVNRATELCFSNHALDRWVKCPMHTQRTTSTLFAVEQTYSTIQGDAVTNGNSEYVTATSWHGITNSVYVNRYMVMPWSSHGGSYPAWTLNTAGNTNINEYAMSCAVATGAHHGFTAASTHNGQDAPSDQGDYGWPNSSYNVGGAYMLIFAR